jgi:hypothetical protein
VQVGLIVWRAQVTLHRHVIVDHQGHLAAGTERDLFC